MMTIKLCHNINGLQTQLRINITPDEISTYVGANKCSMLSMHRVVVNAPKGTVVDHINGDSLDNRKENLRICTNAENVRNSPKHSNNTSGYKGVIWAKREQKWCAQIIVDGKLINLGYYSDK
jgi:hypothetical protein